MKSLCMWSQDRVTLQLVYSELHFQGVSFIW